jgi:hypothetical protein
MRLVFIPTELGALAFPSKQLRFWEGAARIVAGVAANKQLQQQLVTQGR